MPNRTRSTVATFLLWAFSVGIPGAAGASDAALRAVDRTALQGALDATARDLMVPGALVLARIGRDEFVVSFGTTELGADNPPRADTHVRIASVTKTMTAAAIQLLAQDGTIRLDDPVAKYVAGAPNGERITIANLSAMRSGLADYTDAPALADALDHDPARAWTDAELLAIAFERPVLFPPGAAYNYCNTNYVLLGMAAEKASGTDLARIFETRLFGPLEMRDSSLPARTSSALPQPFAHGYLYGGATYALSDVAYPPEVQAAARAGRLKPLDETDQNPSYARAPGGAISTAADLATWIRALVGGKVLNAQSQHAWLDSLQPEDPATPDRQAYGYGIALLKFAGTRMYFHGGEMPGYNSFIGYDPANDVTLIVWANLTLSVDGRLTANTIMNRMLDVIYVHGPGN